MQKSGVLERHINSNLLHKRRNSVNGATLKSIPLRSVTESGVVIKIAGVWVSGPVSVVLCFLE